MQRHFVIAGLVFVMVYLGWLINRMFTARKRRQEYIKVLKDLREQRDDIQKEAESVTDMVHLYMIMVCKHGPKSEEATAFRFGTDSQLMQKLHDDDAIAVFNQQADLIDETWRRQHGV